MAKIIKSNSDKKPELMSVYYSKDNNVLYAAINLNVTESDSVYYWDELVLPDFALNNIHNAPNDIKYEVLVAHIVKAYYNDNQMTAILSNYLSDMENEKYKAEFDELQKLRKVAKETARLIILKSLF